MIAAIIIIDGMLAGAIYFALDGKPWRALLCGLVLAFYLVAHAPTRPDQPRRSS